MNVFEGTETFISFEALFSSLGVHFINEDGAVNSGISM